MAEKVIIPRSWESGNEYPTFSTSTPLPGSITSRLSAEVVNSTISRVNGFLVEASKLTTKSTAKAIGAFLFSTDVLIGSDYDKVVVLLTDAHMADFCNVIKQLEKLSSFIEQENKKVYEPVGIHLVRRMILTILLGAIGALFTFVFVAWLTTAFVPPAPVSRFKKRTPKDVPKTVPLRNDQGRPWAPSAADMPIGVVGGSGFVGSYIVEALIYRGERNIVIFDITEPKKDFQERFPQVKFVKTDICDPESVRKGFEEKKIKVVFHTAAILTYYHNQDFQLPLSIKVNYRGTQNVVEACIQTGVEYLIQTSTSHVSLGFDAFHIDGDETSPSYSAKPFNHYTRSKILAEKAVREANGAIGPKGVILKTACVRPASGIWGFGDNISTDIFLSNKPDRNIVFNTLAIDYVYVENLAHAHSLVEQGLRTNKEGVAGEAFCVSEEDPVSAPELRAIIRAVAPDMVGEDEIFSPNMIWFLCFISSVNQFLFKGKVSLGDLDKLSLSMYRVVMAQYTFKRVLDYRPLYTMEEAAALTVSRHKNVKK
ncbi:hypothetical protein HDU97_001531 [Phlyctochytrium planicorne]|nr:hypothetical protein HDU97_001531 [Phlyctochytrium planicorne]